MNLHAQSCGLAVPANSFVGHVHSIFKSALNIKPHTGSLITILAASHANQPRAIRVPVHGGFQFDQHGISVGDPVASRAGILRFSHSALAIDLRSTVIWYSQLKSFRVDLNNELSRAAWLSTIGMALDHSAASPGIADTAFAVLDERDFLTLSPLKMRSFQAINDLKHATQNRHVAIALDAASSLVGLGPGLTPAGDDFLAGYITGLWATTPIHDSLSCFMEPFLKGLAPHFARTTDISAAFLSDAVNQSPSQTTADLIRAIAEGQSAAMVERAAKAALNVGSTSGADSIAGLLLGLATPAGIST